MSCADNVLNDGKVWKLIDFGLARRVGEQQAAQTHRSTRTVMGSAGFIAKVAAQAHAVSTHPDLFD